MHYSKRLVLVVLAGVVAITAGACEKDPRETSKFPRKDQLDGERRFTQLKHFRLENGINVYIQEEHSDELVAIEVLYRAGFIHEPRNRVQVSHVTEHVVVHSGTKSYQPEEIIERVRRYGMIAAEALGDCVHFDYIVPAEKLDEVLGMEAERMTSLSVNADVIAAEAKKAASEIDAILEDPRGAMTKFGMMSMNQVARYGATFVPVYSGNFDLKVADIESFHNKFYRTDDMVIVLIGGLDTDTAEQIVRKHFESIARKPQPVLDPLTIKGTINATWDTEAEVAYLLFPGPYADFRERIILTMFGSFLRAYVASMPSMQGSARATYVSNQVYPVNEIPFFVFGQANQLGAVDLMADELARVTEEAVAALNDQVFSRIRLNIRGFIESSMIKESNPYVPRQQYIGQEALNVALKHYFREGMPDDEFLAMVDSITLEDMQAAINKYITPENMRVVKIRGR